MGGFWNPIGFFALWFLFFLGPYLMATKPPHRAVMIVVVGAALFGPEVYFFRPPSSPPLTKFTFPMVALMPYALMTQSARIQRAGLFTRIDGLILLGLFGSAMTGITNGDTLVYGSWIVNEIPALSLKDGLFVGIAEFLYTGCPFLLARWFFRRPEHLRDLVGFMVVVGLLQVPFILLELRLSPMIHERVYGVFAHISFLQTLRWGGYRPMVFTQHGLALAIFMFAATYCALLIHRTDKKPVFRLGSGPVFAVLAVILVLCKSTGAILWGLMFFPVLWKTKAKTLQRTAVVLALIVALYPLLRAANWVPIDTVLQYSAKISDERRDSMAFRFMNEGILLEKARERIWFGWGSYGRNGIYSDEIGTKEISVSDGHWIICIGIGGVVWFAEAFGLLVFPVLMAAGARKRLTDRRHSHLLGACSLLLAILAFELIPNGLYANWAYIFAGALAGCAQEIRRNPSAWQGGDGPPWARGGPPMPPAPPMPPPVLYPPPVGPAAGPGARGPGWPPGPDPRSSAPPGPGGWAGGPGGSGGRA